LRRVVLDANVVVSALIRPEGPPGRVVHRFARGEFDVVASPAILAEYRRSLGYPKVRKRLELTDDQIELFVVAVEILALHVEPPFAVAAIPTDPDDEIYVAAAQEGRAEYIVTGDRHLLDLGALEDVTILTPRAFLTLQD
jgi:putative PIN family toxin of toxin-antitoxin system